MIGAESFWAITTDPNHIGAELVWSVILDLALIQPIRMAIRRHDKRNHNTSKES